MYISAKYLLLTFFFITFGITLKAQDPDSIKSKYFQSILPQQFVMTEIRDIPCYFREGESSASEVNYDIVLENIVIVDVTDVPDFLQNIPADFEITLQPRYVSGMFYTSFFVCPIRRNPSSGKVEVLKSFDYSVIVSAPLPLVHSKKTYAANSVLSSGTLYRLSTVNKGIHRITYTDMLSYGINPSAINPDNIHLYGNGSRMIPESNALPSYDDLNEIAISIIGTDDGSFDQSDYILFYAESMVYWPFSSGSLKHEKNLYADKNYFYLKIDGTPGLRINTLPDGSGANFQSQVFQDYGMHEVDQFNLTKSGKTWYGEKFDLTNSYSFSFSFPNIVSDSNYCVSAYTAARSTFPSSFTVSSGGGSTSIGIAATSGYQNDYALTGSGTFCRKPSSSSLSVGISYNNGGNASAVGWLDYIEVLAWRYLVFTGGQMNFRDPAGVKTGNVSEFRLENAGPSVNIWDVTIPERPAIITGTYSGTVFSFTQKTDTLREFIAFNGSSFYSPSFDGIVSNQNLHALGATDFIIVTYPDFYSQAEKIGQLHEQRDGFSYVVVTPQQIYNEFSSGKQDVGAIRNFVKMFYDRAASNEEKPKFLMLVGDGSYDYLSRIANNTNYVPVFQSANSLSPVASYASDDFYGLLDNNEGANCNGNLDIGIGRLPVASVQEAENYYQKLLRYYASNENTGGSMCVSSGCPVQPLADWRNTIVFVGDDGDGNLHFNQTERLTARVDTVYPFVNIDKVYVDAYTQISTSNGERAPEVNRAINDRVAKGALLVNYVGHGGESGWGHERYLQNGDIFSWKNKCNLPVFLTATCEFSRFDDPERRSSGEYVFHQPNGGAIALLTTTRLAYSSYNEALNSSFFEKVFVKTDGQYPTLGQLTAYSKTSNGSALNLRNFSLLGDPALRMTVPNNMVITDSINGIEVTSFKDTLHAYDLVTISGHIEDPSGSFLGDFNGTLFPSVYDKPMKLATMGAGAGNYIATFNLQQNILYKGKVSVTNGRFTFSFYIPRDIQYNFAKGKISYYAENGVDDATGWFENFIIGGSSSALGDNEGPQIALYMNDTLFTDGRITDENPVLLAFVSDDFGINTVGNGIGHDITAVIDGNTANTFVLNAYFTPELDNSKKGVVKYPFSGLSEGEHMLRFKVWDIFNNSSEEEISFVVKPASDMIIQNLRNYPNPFSESTSFVFDHNQACCGLQIEIVISDVNGRVIRVLSHTTEGESYRVNPIYWDGRDSGGQRMSPGVYPYQITVTNANGEVSQKSGKMVIIPATQ